MTAAVDALRTPDARFSDLPDFPYVPRHVEVEGLRIAFIDEGEAVREILAHFGEPVDPPRIAPASCGTSTR